MHRRLFLWLGCTAALCMAAAGPATAQVSKQPTAQSELDRFLDQHGQDLRVRINFDTGYPEEIFGHAMDLGRKPRTALEFESASRQLVDDFSAMLGYDSSVLSTRQVKTMDLRAIGTSSKTAVTFEQNVDGMRVENGDLSLIYDEDGSLLSLSNNGLPGLDRVDLVPQVSDAQAVAIAAAAFGHEVESLLSQEILIVASKDHSGATLAWNVELLATGTAGGVPIQEMITVDARDGTVLRRRPTVHTIDLLGQARGYGTPGNKPDKTGNTPVFFLLQDVLATSPVGNDTTGGDGNFHIVYSGASVQPITVDFSSDSPRAWVENTTGTELGSTKNVTPGVLQNWTMNAKIVPKRTAQINAHRHVNNFVVWTRSIDPTDSVMDFTMRTNVNINDACNAFFNGNSTNYYKQNGGCVNTAYSTVISHEVGHWANVRYGSGNGGDGFGEGNADVFAMYINDTHIVGEDFCGTGCHIRLGTNNRQYCDSCGAGCYGEVHVDGEVHMGAFWKMRTNLDALLGDTAGDLAADTLFVAWMNGYNDKTICTDVRDHLLVLDDNDGNLANGTPHFTQINGGFVTQGFPSF